MGTGAMTALARIDIERRPIKPGGGIREITVKAALPFVLSGGGKYVHRVRSATFHQYFSSFRGEWETWLAVRCWCGTSLNIGGSRRKGKPLGSRMLHEPGITDVVCATCEGRAIGAGLCGAPVIAGRVVKFSPRLRA